MARAIYIHVLYCPEKVTAVFVTSSNYTKETSQHTKEIYLWLHRPTGTMGTADLTKRTACSTPLAIKQGAVYMSQPFQLFVLKIRAIPERLLQAYTILPEDKLSSAQYWTSLACATCM